MPAFDQLRQPDAVAFEPKIWMQLASGQDANELADQFDRMKPKSQDLRRQSTVRSRVPTGPVC